MRAPKDCKKCHMLVRYIGQVYIISIIIKSASYKFYYK